MKPRGRSIGAIFVLSAISCGPDEIIARIERDASNDRGADVESDDATDGAGVVCPTERGASMVSLGDYCIDLTEVTKSEYAAFVASSPLASSQTAACRWNTDFAPTRTTVGTETSCDETLNPEVNDAIAHPQRPVVCVDWCDAHAYCAWAGKRLCGVRGGGSDDVIDQPGNTLNDASKNEWYSACVGPAKTTYPYGEAFDASACFLDETVNVPVDVASRPACHGAPATPNAAIYDQSGNVAEWSDACRPFDGTGTGENDQCQARGGWWKDTRPTALGCAASVAIRLAWPRGRTDSHIGIRCCH